MPHPRCSVVVPAKHRQGRKTPKALASYGEYLASPLWKEIREKVLQRDNEQCVACGAKATQVHHRSYLPAVMSGKDLAPLVAICAKCHHSIEFENGKKTKLSTANKRLKALRAAKGRDAPRTHTGE